MKNKNNLESRLELFALSVIEYCKTGSESPVFKPMLSQLIRSATSIGANYAEAQQAISRKDFTSKVFIAKKEAAETLYWLRLLNRSDSNSQIEQLQKEGNEIMCILQAIAIKLKA